MKVTSYFRTCHFSVFHSWFAKQYFYHETLQTLMHLWDTFPVWSWRNFHQVCEIYFFLSFFKKLNLNEFFSLKVMTQPKSNGIFSYAVSKIHISHNVLFFFQYLKTACIRSKQLPLFKLSKKNPNKTILVGNILIPKSGTVSWKHHCHSQELSLKLNSSSLNLRIVLNLRMRNLV